MRLLFVSHSLPPPDRPLASVGGMQRVAMELQAALGRREDVELSSILLRSSWRWLHVRVVPFLVSAGWRIWQKARREQIDAVLFSSMVTAGLALPLQGVLRRSGVTAGVITHGRDVTLPVMPYQWALPSLFDALDVVLPVSRATGAACRQRGVPEEKLQVIPNGVDSRRFSPPVDPGAARRTLFDAVGDPLPEEALLLCSVGRQVGRKGFAWFTEAVMPRLPETVHWWLAGDGPQAEAIREAARRAGVADRVRLLGRVPEETLRRLYRGADLFVMPNVPVPGDMEGFGVVMLEAGMSGLPTVAARLGGIQDVVEEGQNGHLVAPRDADGFVRLIQHYHSGALDLRVGGRRAAGYVEATFGWAAVAERYVRVIQSLHH